MKKTSLYIALIVLSFGNLIAQTDSCTNLINGALKGQPGNIQDNMFHNLMIDPTNPNIVYAGTETSGMFKTTDGGQTWQRLRLGLKCTVIQTGYPQIFNITADPTTSNIVYASTVNGPGPTTGYLYPSASAGLYKSIDGGTTWQQHNNGFTNSYNTFLLVHPNNSQELFTAIAGLKATQPSLGGQFFTGGFYKSTNAGSSWFKLNTPQLTDSNSVWNAVYTKFPQPIIYTSWHAHDAGIFSLGLIKSTDNGNSWSVINPAGVVIGNFDVFKKNNNYIIGTDNSSEHWAYSSSDGGINWTPLNKKFFGEFKIHPTDSSIVFFLGGGKSINRTINGFQTTQVVYIDNTLTDTPPRQYMDDVKISESNPSIVWVAAQGYFLYKSTDGGSTFTKITAIRDSIYKNVVHLNTKILILDTYKLYQNYPNPFNPETTIRFHVAKSSFITLKVYDVLGRETATLVNSQKTAGNYQVKFDASFWNSGIYVYQLHFGDGLITKRMVFLK